MLKNELHKMKDFDVIRLLVKCTPLRWLTWRHKSGITRIDRQ